ncbi:hypothetical protein [Lewinella sp. LCG006]|uniref:hypothetical protein n=1 Tax=Lewinella sp. LCG006 TaxID=3231911 RepID=UPI003460D366
MKQILLTTMIVFLGGLAMSIQANNHYFVHSDGQGEGTSWKDAASNLQEVLAKAKAGDIIWVANGTYFPTNEADRTASFIIPDGVQVYGGFIGEEKKLTDRVLGEAKTILSGEIGTEAPEDNSYTVVYFQNASAATMLDGFIITGGYADGLVEGADLTTCGAGIYNNGEFGVSSPMIQNCILINNFSREGAAIYNYANEGETSPTISDCQFVYNRSDFNGGAIFNDGNFGTCNPTITNCSFKGNESMYGAGILNRGLYGECQPMIKNSTFIDNFSVVRGGAIYNQREGRGICEALLEGNVFEDNGSTIGEGDVDQTNKALNVTQDQPSKAGVRMRSAEAISY